MVRLPVENIVEQGFEALKQKRRFLKPIYLGCSKIHWSGYICDQYWHHMNYANDLSIFYVMSELWLFVTSNSQFRHCLNYANGIYIFTMCVWLLLIYSIYFWYLINFVNGLCILNKCQNLVSMWSINTIYDIQLILPTVL